MFLHKKGVTEITSFVLITLLVVTTSIIAYQFSKSTIEDSVAKNDYNNMEIYFNNLIQKTNQVQKFEGQSFGMGISFSKGSVVVEGNTIHYRSLIDYLGTDYCYNGLCHTNSNDAEQIYFNLSSGYNFSSNMTLLPGSYFLIFKNNKNVSKIDLSFK
ncbi:MAG: hypothetical protein PF569_09700 [Candidatus Woesearchaeota archaeon]|nr:hypothetical protein [Candidatus Woesearchaeota archaeon]